jgi:hypothetical protein
MVLFLLELSTRYGEYGEWWRLEVLVRSGWREGGILAVAILLEGLALACTLTPLHVNQIPCQRFVCHASASVERVRHNYHSPVGFAPGNQSRKRSLHDRYAKDQCHVTCLISTCARFDFDRLMSTDAPHLPVMKYSDYPEECEAFMQENKSDSSASTARKAVTGHTSCLSCQTLVCSSFAMEILGEL